MQKSFPLQLVDSVRCIKYVAHFKFKRYKLSEPTGTEQRLLADTITSLYLPNYFIIMMMMMMIIIIIIIIIVVVVVVVIVVVVVENFKGRNESLA
jgi:hypothetical protein